ncbi:MAG: DUF4262 domain-containing protein [Hyphomonas sp.]|nr:DUF4262 domain-containing protein [Hyphomonas sp.]MCB9961810.1 DUF4262 domain-containing protein [Hyphomonas sp.]MCB9972695.1 DUF4262 domain-containing protein [Hyphomonas sp.]MCC0017541.1 DUF4262 domain-containing protein [Rhodobiaceae bacterium]HPE48096.1 DUF4262 domain-containing protein [Hyphomonas sp.]
MALSPELLPIAAGLDRDGWTKVYIQKTPGDPNSRILFTTTIGMQEKFGVPELVLFGLNQETIDGVIHNVAAKLVQEHKWTGAPMRMDGVLNEADVELRAVHPEHLNEVGAMNIMVRRETGRPPLMGMIQIFWPGDDGRFPWDPESTDPFRDQPRLDVSWKKDGGV